MKNLLNRQYLLLSVIVCLLISLLSLFFLPVDEFKWGLLVISFLASFIASFFIVALAKNGGRKRVIFIRYSLAALVLVCAWLYVSAWNSIVCKAAIKEIKNEQVFTTYKNVITGTELIDKSDSLINALNKTKERCSIREELNENNPEKIWTPASVNASKIKLYASFLLLLMWLAVLLVYLAVEILLRGKGKQVEDKVFISYNHKDQELARQLCDALEQNNIPLIVDSPNTASGNKVENMVAGDDIYTFIHNAVAGSRITLMIVSEESLLSGWVATETVNTFFLESFDETKFFIACYVDKSFMDNDFATRAYAFIDQKLDEINQHVIKRIDQQADSRDLNDQKTRLLALRGNLDKTIHRLQHSLCIDISGGKLQDNLGEIIKAIRLRFTADDE